MYKQWKSSVDEPKCMLQIYRWNMLLEMHVCMSNDESEKFVTEQYIMYR